MRAITVRQPWAWAIIHDGKDVENRSRNIAGAYRGPVAIHAGLAIASGAWESPVLSSAWLDGGGDEVNPGVLGAFIGVVDLVDVHDARYHAAWARDGAAAWSPWAEKDVHHLILANPRPLPRPIPAKGRLGMWTPDEEVQAAIRDQIGDLS